METKCTICNHPDKEKIEAAIVARRPLARLAKEFSTTDTTLRRHRENCLKPAIQGKLEAQRNSTEPNGTQRDDEIPDQEEQDAPFDALSAMDWMRKETRALYKEVRQAKEYRFALQALAELRRQNELCAKLVGELDENSVVITAIPEWRELRALLLDALSMHPQAKMAVIRALEAYDREQSA